MLLFKSAHPKQRKSAYIQERLPIFALENDKVIFRDGRVAVGFRVQGAPLESWSEGYFRQASEVLTRQLKLLPVGTVVQKTDIYYDQAFQPTVKATAEGNPAYYQSRLLEHFTARLVLQHESYLFISIPSKSRHR